ncbi:H(+)/Cl(-) exchange transporter ClcA [Aggregatibacter actinomycetemcomitans]|uniref:chloride channel protein n=2 Tax=Aggregatibacter actinomycetemcomitans TaxID=714 RepID=UPI0001B9F427|nr:chloride channel protein [Aggregatibacter actinomycetemcomitans]ACX81509.1 chloride channel protein EriC [Aggregatibacter actinomycetemcomitans D11S-1]KOE58947.1 chloride channel protein EriC [Aggregatibacter actinomycetemcomitans serotype c str. SCC2302]KOE59622.1 chloride channel protein EriC [Aggregatibacter actinomycetemcomitans serotype c str. AAS4A]KYK75567.1 EriC protein [Aggregatibacter actinomycetemcomitans serotype e str. SA2149]KYK82153.1 EriC protein [Aggregatibacter actinomycet
MNAFITSLRHFVLKVRYVLHKKLRQSHRLSHKTVEFSCLMIGAALVSLFSLGFAKLADLGLEWNAQWTQQYPLAAWVVMPCGLAALAWFVLKYTPYVGGSGIPQVIASLSLPHNSDKTRLVAFAPTLWKIPLTFLAMLFGASVGREGPSVQVGAAVMLWWGNLCRQYGVAFKGLSANELMATGAAGGLAAAFNAPLAGVIFAIEELGRGVLLRWERRVLLGVLAAGFILVAIDGNNPYFPKYHGVTDIPYLYLWVLLCGVVCGVFGGIFARLLAKGVGGVLPNLCRGWVRNHPIYTAFILGLILTALGLYTNGQTYGTGYHVVTQALDGQAMQTDIGIMKLFATVGTYWTGIAGGIFTPSLTIGAGLGVQVATLTDGLIDQRLLVLLCMAAFLAGATQSPVTASVIVMEMTGCQPVLIWLLICCLISSIISRQFNPKPFYHFAAGRFRHRIQEEMQQDMKDNS